jgi:predicted nucleic acid-binding protein
MTYLLDTNVLSETRKPRRDPGLMAWISATSPADLYLSVLTIGEIEQGVARLLHRGDHQQAAVFGSWLDDVVREFGERVIPITARIARQWGRRSSAHPAPAVDALIAATARAHDWTLVTRNTRDFEHSDGRVLNPFSG